MAAGGAAHHGPICPGRQKPWRRYCSIIIKYFNLTVFKYYLNIQIFANYLNAGIRNFSSTNAMCRIMHAVNQYVTNN